MTLFSYLRAVSGRIIAWTWILLLTLWYPRTTDWLISFNMWWIGLLIDFLANRPPFPWDILGKTLQLAEQFLSLFKMEFGGKAPNLSKLFSLGGILTILLGRAVPWVWNLVMRWKRRKAHRIVEGQAFEEEITEDLPAEPEPESKFTFPLTEIEIKSDPSARRIQYAAEFISDLSKSLRNQLINRASGKRPRRE